MIDVNLPCELVYDILGHPNSLASATATAGRDSPVGSHTARCPAPALQALARAWQSVQRQAPKAPVTRCTVTFRDWYEANALRAWCEHVGDTPVTRDKAMQAVPYRRWAQIIADALPPQDKPTNRDDKAAALDARSRQGR
jgi:hypothetical protein